MSTLYTIPRVQMSGTLGGTSDTIHSNTLQ